MVSDSTRRRRQNKYFRDLIYFLQNDPDFRGLFEMVEMHKRLIVLHEEELQKAQAEEHKARFEYKALLKDIKDRKQRRNEKNQLREIRKQQGLKK